MNKLTMAHEYVMNYMASPDCKDTTVSNIVSVAWSYADAMQAEADKREDRTRPAVLNMANSPQLDWQPDWSQAPKGFNRFVVGSDGGCGFFTNMEPQLQDDFWFVGADGIVIRDHGYQGNWQDSLRKRPQ